MSYNSALVKQMPKRSTVQENAELHQRVVSGDREARKRMIEGNMPLVVAKVEKLVGRYPQLSYLHDDLVSAGFLGLVNAVNAIDNLPPSDSNMVVGYIAKSITTALAHEIEACATIRVSRRSLKRIQGKGDAPPTVSALDHDPAHGECDAIVMFETREMLVACCETDDERETVALREDGYTAEEIATHLGISCSTVWRMLRNIKARYDEKMQQLQ